MYATLRLLAHEQQSSNTSSHPASSAKEELVFIQAKPLTRSGPHRTNAHQSTEKKDATANDGESQVPSGPLLPPPRRQASLRVTTAKSALEDSSPIRRTNEDKSTTPKHAEKASPIVPRRIGHVKSKSTDVTSNLPSSTPLLNPFRAPKGAGSTGFVSPPPVPPKPTKMATAARVETTTPLLVAIDDDHTPSRPDSNPFRRKSVPNAGAGDQEDVYGTVSKNAKPPLPPRQSLSHEHAQSASLVELGDPIEPPNLPTRQSTVPASASTSQLRRADTVSRAPSSQFRAPTSSNSNITMQPTSLSQPSRLIKQGLLAAQKARESQTSMRVPSPNHIITLANYTSQHQNSTMGARTHVGGAPRSDRSYPKRNHNRDSNNADDAGRHRSSTLSSITTGGTTSSGSSISTIDRGGAFHNPHFGDPVNGNRGPAHASPFSDPDWIDTSLPPPPRRTAPVRRDATAQAPASFDIIATSGDEEAQMERDLSRRSTLKGGHTLPRRTIGSNGPIVEQGLSAMKDLGEDVRRAAEGVGKDLEWMRGGRGGRTLGMAFPREEDDGGDARKGLIDNIERDNTGSTTLSNDFEHKI